MTTFVLITAARAILKGNLIVKCVSLGELKHGNKKDGTQFQRQQAVLKDNSGIQELTLWDNDIGRLEAGKYYKLDNPYWNTYKNEPQLSLGNYCTVMECLEADLLALPPGQAAPQPQPTNQQFTSPSVTPPAETQKPDVTQEDLRKLAEKIISPALLPSLKNQLEMLWALEFVTKDFLQTKEGTVPDKARVGMFVKMLELKPQ